MKLIWKICQLINVGNFRSLLLLQARHDDVVRERILSGPKNAPWIGHDLQNSLISIMAEWVLKTIISEVKIARYYTLIVDETKGENRNQFFCVPSRRLSTSL